MTIVRYGSRYRRDQKTRQRNHDMAELYRAGHILEEIGAKYGVTRERVRQILVGMGLNKSDGGGAFIAKVNREIRAKQHRAKCLEKWGMDKGGWKRLRAMHEDYKRTPLPAYVFQKNNARHRGIPWQMNLAQWWAIWEASGKWDERGIGSGQYVMSRYLDSGPYAPWNVCIQTTNANIATGKTHGKLRRGGVELRADEYIIKEITSQFEVAA